LREEKHYDRLGTVGYCAGGSAAIALASKALVDTAVIVHPGMFSMDEIKAIKIPTAWACAEDDMIFGVKKRTETEAVFTARKGKDDYVEYEFVDYKGTVHGYGARPNLGIPVVKEAFENTVSQTENWFKKTL